MEQELPKMIDKLASRKGSGIGGVIVILIILFFVYVAIDTFFNDKSGGGDEDDAFPLEPKPPDKQGLNESQWRTYRLQALDLASYLSSLPAVEIPEIRYPRDWENFTDTIYAGALIAEFTFRKENIGSFTGLAKAPTEIRVKQKELEDIVPLYNIVVQKANDISQESSNEEIYEFVLHAGELGGKITYVYWRDELLKIKSFFSGISNAFQETWNKIKESKNNVIIGIAQLADSAGNFIAALSNEVVPEVDEILYDGSGAAGAYALNGILIMSSWEEEYIRNEIKPRVENFINNIDLEGFKLV